MSQDSEGVDTSREDWRNTTDLGRLKCTSRDCPNDLHAFRLKRTPRGRPYRYGSCIGCGFDEIDWDRLDRRDVHDVNYTIRSLKYEMIRNYYWGRTPEDGLVTEAVALGLDGIRRRTRTRLEKIIGPPQKAVFRDGYMTPWGDSIIHYAQHGTGTCCRRCLETWHGINRNTELSAQNLNYFTQLILQYTRVKVPSIRVGGQKS